MKSIVCDLDDLWCEEQITLHLLPLREAVPAFKVTLFSIPNKLGPVHLLKPLYPWITFAIHGWEHTFAECRSWSEELAKVNIEQALAMGYEPIFKPPQWIMDEAIEVACRDLDVVLAHHDTYTPSARQLLCYPGPKALRLKKGPALAHSHIERSPATDFVTECPEFQPEFLAGFDTFLTPRDAAIRIP